MSPESNEIDITKLCTISEDVRHTAPAVFAHLKALFQTFKESGKMILYLFTDGSTAQYRNKASFSLICHFAKQFDFKKVIWNIWEVDMEKELLVD